MQEPEVTCVVLNLQDNDNQGLGTVTLYGAEEDRGSLYTLSTRHISMALQKCN